MSNLMQIEVKNNSEIVTEQDIIDQNYKYFLEFQKLNDAKIILTSQLNDVIKEKNSLKNTLNKLESNKKNEISQSIINDSYNIRRVSINCIAIFNFFRNLY